MDENQFKVFIVSQILIYSGLTKDKKGAEKALYILGKFLEKDLDSLVAFFMEEK